MMRDGASQNESVRIPTHIRSIIDPEGAVLLDLKAGRYYSLNTLGALIWNRLESGDLVSDVIAAVSTGCGAAADVVRRDVGHFISELRRKGLVDAE